MGRSQCRQLSVQIRQPGNDELDAAIRARQPVEDLAVEHEHAPHVPG
jgi:hypothetical protein